MWLPIILSIVFVIVLGWAGSRAGGFVEDFIVVVGLKVVRSARPAASVQKRFLKRVPSSEKGSNNNPYSPRSRLIKVNTTKKLITRFLEKCFAQPSE